MKLKSKSQVQKEREEGVVMVRHFPAAFTASAMKKYFSQFGTVIGVRMSRSKKTGRLQPHAMVLFAKSLVAKVAAEAMDNYLMFGKLMRCTFVPFNGYGRSLFKKQRKRKTTRQVHKEQVNSFKEPITLKNNAMRKMKRLAKCAEILSKTGLSFKPVVINDFILSWTEKNEGGTAAEPTAKSSKPQAVKSPWIRPFLRKKTEEEEPEIELPEKSMPKPIKLKARVTRSIKSVV